MAPFPGCAEITPVTDPSFLFSNAPEDSQLETQNKTKQNKHDTYWPTCGEGDSCAPVAFALCGNVGLGVLPLSHTQAIHVESQGEFS